MQRAVHGMFVSVNVGSVSPEFIIRISAFSATRMAMWLWGARAVPRVLTPSERAAP